MKIAIMADGSRLNANVARRMGSAEYVLIVNTQTNEFESLPNPARSQQRGTGVQAIALAVEKGVSAVLTGYCNPVICSRFEDSGVEIITGIRGTVAESVERFIKENYEGVLSAEPEVSSGIFSIRKDRLINAARTSSRQFVNLLPVMISVVLLMGLFRAFVSEDFFTTAFSGNYISDTLLGAFFGSIFAGNPVSSYIIGGELLGSGVSLVAVTAFILAWVTVGIIQLPAEIKALGYRFAFIRNALCFIFAIIAAILVALIEKAGGSIL